MNPGCVSPASASTMGDFAKSLACQQIPKGAAEGTYLHVHRRLISGQRDATFNTVSDPSSNTTTPLPYNIVTGHTVSVVSGIYLILCCSSFNCVPVSSQPRFGPHILYCTNPTFDSDYPT